ncbi:hypothetical protein HGA91_05245 [candidate division WWE3 bacterium]|nr:hypothetical protein [candidate division WWE3 bacterium]
MSYFYIGNTKSGFSSVSIVLGVSACAIIATTIVLAQQTQNNISLGQNNIDSIKTDSDAIVEDHSELPKDISTNSQNPTVVPTTMQNEPTIQTPAQQNQPTNSSVSVKNTNGQVRIETNINGENTVSEYTSDSDESSVHVSVNQTVNNSQSQESKKVIINGKTVIDE